MSTLHFTDAAVTNWVSANDGALATTSTTGVRSAALGSGSSNYNSLYVMKGSIPTDWTTFTSLSTRQSDILFWIPIYTTPTSLGTISNSKRYIFGQSNTGYNNYSVSSGYATNRTNNLVSVSVTSSGYWPFYAGQQVVVSASNTAYNGTFTLASNSGTVLTWAQTGTNITSATVTLTMTFSVAASQTGTASWFLMAPGGTGGGSNFTFSPASVFDSIGFTVAIGTVGVTGSGADLEMPTTAIIQNKKYTASGFYMNMPLTWDV